MKILLTGSSGFIGTKLFKRLCDKFGIANIVCLKSDELLRFDKKDITEIADLNDIEVIFHAGSFTPKNQSQANDVASCNSNIIFTDLLLRLNLPNLKKVIYLSTLDVYGYDDLISEKSPLKPATLYGSSKLYCENMVMAFCKNKNIICNILRIGHVYGPGEEKYEKVLPKSIMKILAGEPVELWGDGSELRSLIYIDDVITACVSAFELNHDLLTINVVSENAVSIISLLERVGTISGCELKIIKKEVEFKSRSYIFDSSMMKQYLLEAETDLNAGLSAEIDYFRSLT